MNLSRPCAILALALGALSQTALAAFTVDSPTTDWVPVAYGPNALGDVITDQQTGSGEADIVGNTGSLATSLPSFYTKLVPGSSSTNGTLYFRIRLGGDQNPVGFKAVALIGIDANRDGKLDVFLGVNNSGSADSIDIWKAGSGLNISPSTTSMVSKTPVKKYTVTSGTNYYWNSVTSTSATPGVALDPTANTAAKQDFNSATGTDYMLSFSIPMQDLVAALSAQGITFNSSSVVTYVMGTSTQANAFNQDLNGVSGSTSSTLTWASLGVLSQPVSSDGTVVNSAPVNTLSSSRTANGSLAITGTSVNDPDGNLATVVLTATHGTVNVSLASGAVVTSGANSSATMTLGGTQAQINAALATLGFTPTSGYTGAATVTMVSTDSGSLTDTDSVAITVVSGPNTAPVANADTASTHSSKPVDVYVIGNDTDADGNVLTITNTTLTAGQGTVSSSNGTITYTPTAAFAGTATINYTISDGFGGTSSSTLTVTVAANHAPVAVNDTINTNQNTTIFISALANDTDSDGDPLTITAATRASGNGTVTNLGDSIQFDSPNQNGTTVINYTISDGFGLTSTATVTVTIGTNTAPVAVADTATANSGTPKDIDVLVNDSDANGDPLIISDAVVTSGNGTAIALNGKLRFTPAANFTGVALVTYTIDDGRGGTASAVVTITVTNNTAPTATADTYAATEDTTLTVNAPGVLSNDTDAENNSLSAVLISSVSHGSLTLNSDGSFTYTPAANYNGSDSFTYQATDGSLNSSTVTVTLNVAAVNDAPVAFADSYNATEDTALTITAPGVLSNDTDVENSALTAVVVSGVSHGSLTLNANGSFTYTPAANYNGPDSFSYKANDGSLDSNVATVTLNVAAVNDAPVAAVDSYNATEDTTLTISSNGVLSNDTDVDGNTLTAVLVAGPSHGSLTLNSDGTFTYTPAANYNGTDSFTYKANDGTANSNVVTVSLNVAAVNDAPVAVVDSYNATEDTTLTINAPGVLSNDTDVDSATLTAVLVGNVSHGSLTLNADGSFSYTPASNYNGPDSFTYKANDGTANSNVVTVTLNVAAVNDAPVAAVDSYNATEDTTLTITAPGVLSNDTDVDSATLTAVLVGNVSHGSLTLNADGSFSYTPAANFNGTDSFTYKANDGTTNSNVVTVTLNVAAVNDAPVAAIDSYNATEDTTLTITAPGVLSNDTDVDGNSLTAVLVGDVSHGSLSLNANGSFTYTPAANFNGTDSFTYKANDGTTNSNVVTVTLNVAAVNDAPVAAIDSYNATEDTTLTITAPGVLSNDTDVDGNSLTAVLVGDVSHGSLTLNPNGSFTYIPAANFNGTDSFTYKANDGTTNSNVVTVTLNVAAVNDAPVAAVDSYNATEDTTLTITAPGVLSNDSDVDGNSLTASVVTGVSHGSLTLNPNGSFTYTPAANFNGTDSFTYQANDGTTNSNVATVTINVAAVNDAPVAGADSYNATEDTALPITAPGVLSNDTDVDGNSLTVAVVTGPSHGTLTLNPNGSFLYTPAANYNGTDSFTYKANDGTTDSNLATVTIDVAAVNDAPIAGADSYNATEDTALTITAPGVLGNDTDVDGNTLTAVVVGNPAHGSLTLNADGSFTYTPAANFNGTDSFTYKANDGTTNSNVATVTINVAAVNDAPVAAVDNYTATEDTALHIAAPGVLGNDSDVDGNTLTAVLVGNPSHGTLTLNADGSFTYTPEANFNGTDSFTYQANDGTTNSNIATVTLNVSAVNDAPVAVLDSYTATEDTVLTVNAPGVLTNDTDVDGNTLTAVLVTDVGHGTLTLNPNGSFTYTPAANFHGTDSFTYKANDGTTNSNTVTVTLNVGAVNDAPVGTPDQYTVAEDGTLNVSAPGVLGNDTDAEGDAMHTVLVTDVAHGTLTLNPDGSFSYKPTANFHGDDSFTYHVSDGTAESGDVLVTLTVSSVNDAPTATIDSYSIAAGGTLSTAAPGVLANDQDVDGDTLTATLVTGVSHGTLTLNPDGSFSYTPITGFSGADSFTYKAGDSTDFSADTTVSITVFTVNGAPVATADSYNATAGVVLNVAAPGVLGNDTDPDSNPLHATLVGNVAHGTLSFGTNGSFTYTAASNFSGTDTFTYQANDGSLDSATVTVSIVVAAPPVNHPPTLTVPATLTTAIGTPVPFTGTTTDQDGDTVTVTFTGPAHGTISGTGPNYVYTPGATFAGTDTIIVRADDGHGGVVSKTIHIDVATPDYAVGNYALFLYDTSGEIAGHITLTCTKFGRATGVVTVGGVRYTIRGFFGGAPVRMLPRSKNVGSVVLNLNLDQTNPLQPEVVTSVTDAAGTYTGRSPRSPYSKTHPATQAGKYTLIASRQQNIIDRTGITPAGGDSSTPAVASVLTVRVQPTGVVIFKGYTGTGYALTCSSYIMPNRQVPFYAGRRAPGASIAYSSLTFPADRTAQPEPSEGPAITGTLRWLANRERRIATPIDAEYAVLGAHYVAPADGTGLFNTSSITLSLNIPSYADRGLANPWEETRTVAGNKLPQLGTSVSATRLTLSTGLYLGRVQGRVTRPYFGVIIEGEGINLGLGSLLDFTELGTCELRPVISAPAGQ